MLVLTRKLGEKIHIGDDIVVHLLNSDPVKAKIGIEAPRHIRVLRDDARETERPERGRLSRDELEEKLQEAEALACKRAKSLDERDREIERLMKERDEARNQEKAAWENRDRFCEHINIIAKEALGFNHDHSAPDAVSREVKKLVDQLRAEIGRKDAAVSNLIQWLDERRSAPDMTTFGMIQDELRSLLSPAEEGKEAR